MAIIDKVQVGNTTYDIGGGDKYTTCTLPAFTAAGNKAVTVSGVTANSTPILDVVTSTTAATAETQIEAWSHIYAATTSANTITFYSNAATSEITVSVKSY